MVSLANSITLAMMNMEYALLKEDKVFLGNTKIIKMAQITQKDLYEDAILYRSEEHSYKQKWARELDTLIVGDEVWNTIHHFPVTNKTKTTI